MGTFNDAIVALDTRRCTIAVVGDSALEGQGATNYTDRLQHVLLNRLHAEFGTDDTEQVQHRMYYNDAASSSAWQEYGERSSTEGIIPIVDYSMGQKGWYIMGGNYWRSPQRNFRYVEVEYSESQEEFAGLGAFTLYEATDMGAPVWKSTVNTAFGAGMHPGKRMIYDFGSLADRRVAVFCNDGAVLLTGVRFFKNDPVGSGFSILDNTVAGASSNNMPIGSATMSGWSENSAVDLVIDDLWHNDWMAALKSPTDTAISMGQRIDRYREVRSGVDVITYGMWNVPAVTDPNSPNALGFSLNDYRAAVASVSSDKGARFLDLSQKNESPSPSWFSEDNIHMNAAGQAEASLHLFNEIMSLVDNKPPIFIAETQLSAIKVGSTDVKSVFVGGAKVWP